MFAKKMLVFVLVMAAACGSGMGEGGKIGIVDMSKVLDACPDTEANRLIIESKVKEMEEEHNGMLDRITAQRSEFDAIRKEAGNKALSESARSEKIEKAEEKLTILRQLEKDLQETVNTRRREIGEQRMRMHRRTVEKLRDVIGKYAEKNGFSLVLDSSALGMNGVETVLYSVDKSDVTQDIVDRVKKEKK